MNTYKLGMWWWHSRWRRWYYKIKYRLTGDCGHYCAYHYIFNFEDNRRYRMFIPEAGCVIHDVEDDKDDEEDNNINWFKPSNFSSNG